MLNSVVFSIAVIVVAVAARVPPGPVPPAQTPPPGPEGQASAPSAVASPAPAAAKETPLKEIGRVTSSAACTNIVVRANSAIGATLRNDQTVALAVNTLRRVDLDNKNAIEKNKAVREIDRLATDLRMSAGNGEGQIKKLRDLAEASTDPVRKADLKEFADALGGALSRQKRIGADMQRMLVIMEGRQARAEIHEVIGHNQPEYQQLFSASDANLDVSHFTQMAQSAAKEIEDRTLSIAADESKAADHIAGAVNGCS